jgi:hypothetical protein
VTVSDDEENPVLTAMVTMAQHGITLDAARADSERLTAVAASSTDMNT